jgi:hypothetical protein
MARSTSKTAASKRANSADSTPLVDPLTYTDGTGFKPGNAAAGDKFKTVDGKIVDDLKGEPGWQVVVKGDKVTPAIAREIAGDDSTADDES